MIEFEYVNVSSNIIRLLSSLFIAKVNVMMPWAVWKEKHNFHWVEEVVVIQR